MSSRRGEVPGREPVHPEAAETRPDGSPAGGGAERPSGESSSDRDQRYAGCSIPLFFPPPLWSHVACLCLSDMLELYFEKQWEVPEDVVLIPDEQAAVVSFRSPKGSTVF